MVEDSFQMIQLTKDVVVSHLSTNTVSDDALPDLIREVYKAFLDVQQMHQAHLDGAAHLNKSHSGLDFMTISQKRTPLREILNNAAAPSSSYRRPAQEDDVPGTSVDTSETKAV